MSRYRPHRRHPRGMAWSPPEEMTGFSGEATLIIGEQVLAVTVHLDGHLEPLDGCFHWYGRIERSAAIATIKDAGATVGALSIGGATPAEIRLAEYDFWGHLQVKGTGAPPYRMDHIEIELPAGALTSS